MYKSATLARLPAAAILATGAAAPTRAHEAWLLTPSEIEALSRAPMPAIFTSSVTLGAAAAVACLIAIAALRAEDRLGGIEARLAAPMARAAGDIGPLAIRIGLALMLALGALGLLPRAGVTAWAQPTFFVPDMQLSLVPGWDLLAPIQLLLAVALAVGLGARIAGLAVIALSGVGLMAFGAPFLGYAPHFAAPGLMLVILGGGAASLDRSFGMDAWLRPGARLAGIGWSTARALLGLTFVYLAATYKLTQPTLIMAILDHGQMPLMGLPAEYAALAMTFVELLAGMLLAFGRLTRPIALFLIGAFTFFALTLGETPLFHANLYGAMAMLLLAGRAMPDRVAAPESTPDFTLAARS